ncbi:MAG: hypothetical protein JO004_04150 [Methylobacteriaceae bacterium]|nr:hypothetical protein [Methylobacteriaceae bacterium]
MSRLQRERHRKKLHELLSKADDEGFCEMVWAIDALQSDRVEAAKPFIEFPPEAATSEIGSDSLIHKWELETLISQLLITPKKRLREDRNVFLNCKLFSAGANAINFLRKLEEAEAGIYLKRFNILYEMHRLGQRQFSWQRGYANIPQLYRYAYIYNHGGCAQFFEDNFGLSLNHLSLVGFALYSAFLTQPIVGKNSSIVELGIQASTVDRALRLLVAPLDVAQRQTAAIIKKAIGGENWRLPVAYRPSFIRQRPIISFGTNQERLRAPLVQLILLRITSGIYHDLVDQSSLRNEASRRFEGYCERYIRAMMSRFKVHPSHSYQLRGNEIESPDISIEDQGKIVVAVECKATKLSFSAQFAEDPADNARRNYGEIAKGVFQLWRYFAHTRRTVVNEVHVSNRACGMVLTLDTWLTMSAELQDEVLATAAQMANKDRDIKDEDRRPVVFCTIQDPEAALARSDEDSFLNALIAAGENKFRGWALPNIIAQAEHPRAEIKPFPFKLGDVLPWWDEVEEMRKRLSPRQQRSSANEVPGEAILSD